MAQLFVCDVCKKVIGAAVRDQVGIGYPYLGIEIEADLCDKCGAKVQEWVKDMFGVEPEEVELKG
jgi:hypothetical protein